MARFTVEQARSALESTLPLNTPMQRQELVDALEASGNLAAVSHFQALKAQGILRGYIRLNEDGTTSHVYELIGQGG